MIILNKKNLFIFIVLFSFFCNCSFSKKKQFRYNDNKLDKINDDKKIIEINAIVGNEIILNSELKKRNYINENFLDSKEKFCRSLFSNEALYNDDLLIQKLMIHYAKINNIKINDKNIEKTINDIFENILRKFNKSSKKKFLQTIFNNKSNKKEFIEKLIHLTNDKQYIEQVTKYLTKDVKVYPEEVKYLFENKKNSLPLIPKKYMISYIGICPIFKNDFDQNKINLFNYLKNIREKLLVSSDSCSYMLLNKDITSVSGCILKKVKLYKFSKNIKDIILSMKEKDVTEPFETNFGYHLIKLEYIDKKKNEFWIRHIFIKKSISKEEMTKTKSFANIFRNKIICNYNGKIENINFKKEKKINNSVNIFFKKKIWVDENNISKCIKNLKKNSISQVISGDLNGKKAFFIIKILDILDERPLYLYNDYKYLENIIKYVKKKYIIINWGKEMLKKTYYKKY